MLNHLVSCSDSRRFIPFYTLQLVLQGRKLLGRHFEEEIFCVPAIPVHYRFVPDVKFSEVFIDGVVVRQVVFSYGVQKDRTARSATNH
jgi:hypothetical protein